MMPMPNDSSYYFHLFLPPIIAALVLYFFLKACSLYVTTKKPLLPPSPRALPVIGHLHLLSSSLPKSLQTLAFRHGPLMLIRFGATPIYVVTDPDIAREMLKTHDVDFASKYVLGFGFSQYDIYRGFSFVNAEYGVYWRFMKKLCVTQLFTSAQLHRFSHIREQEVSKLLQSLIQKSREGKPCDVGKELPAMANQIICRMAIGKRCEEDGDLPKEIRRLTRDMMQYAAKLSFNEIFGPLKMFDLLGNGKRLASSLWEFDGLMEEMIKNYQDKDMKNCGNEGKDVMELLLETYHDTNAELKLTKSHIKNFFLEIFFAGVDTSSAVIQFALLELINNPKILKKLREEMDSVLGGNRLIKESDVENLPFLQAIVKETLRVHPAGPLLRRQCNVDTKINGYDIQAGTRIIINAYAIMRDPKAWNKPEKFLPERFMVDKSDVSSNKYGMDLKGSQDFNFLPFGSGRRACPGVGHALNVVHTTIGALAQCFEWEVKDGDKIDIKIVTGYSGAMALPLVCYPITRFDPFKP